MSKRLLLIMDWLFGHKWVHVHGPYFWNDAWCIEWRCSRCGELHTAWDRNQIPETPSFIKGR